MVGNKGKTNQTVRPNFEANLGRDDGDTNHAEFDMSGKGVGGQQAAGSKWLQIDALYRSETSR